MFCIPTPLIVICLLLRPALRRPDLTWLLTTRWLRRVIHSNLLTENKYSILSGSKPGPSAQVWERRGWQLIIRREGWGQSGSVDFITSQPSLFTSLIRLELVITDLITLIIDSDGKIWKSHTSSHHHPGRSHAKYPGRCANWWETDRKFSEGISPVGFYIKI